MQLSRQRYSLTSLSSSQPTGPHCYRAVVFALDQPIPDGVTTRKALLKQMAGRRVGPRNADRHLRTLKPRNGCPATWADYANQMPSRVLRERLIDLEVPGEDVARGRALRKTAPRRAIAQLTPSPRTATEILVAQNANRLPELVPLRFARMLADPFSFYRGSAAVMAADLAASPSTGIEVMCCGDAHVSNFGMYGAPHRSIVFDLNDFDEAAVAPAEWDVKRLITSAIIGGRHAGYPAKAIRRSVEQALVGYQTSLKAMLEEMSVLDRYYLRVEPEHYTGKVSKESQTLIQNTISRASTRTSTRVFKQITEIRPETPRLHESPPVLQHVDERSKPPWSSPFRIISPQSQLTSRCCCHTFA